MPASSSESGVSPANCVRVARANLYLTRETCDARLAGLQSIALLERDGNVWIVPLVAGSAGGLLLKVRNARGDRVIHAQEFFREHGFAEEFDEREYPMTWDSQHAVLVVTGVPHAKV